MEVASNAGMKVLVIGGSGFIGPSVIRELQRNGHKAAVFHRGGHINQTPSDVEHILGDRRHISEYVPAFRQFAPEVVIDIILSSGRQARELMDAMRGIARRVVAISSGDVYRAFSIVNRNDEGPLQPVPLTEDSERRRQPAYPPERMKMLQEVFGWMDDEYDKIPVEDTTLSDRELEGTVLRLPMVYGAGDPLHRFFSYVKRIDDRRPRMILTEDLAAWRSPRGYVENVAAAIVAAATSPKAVGRAYNVAEQPAFSELEWANKIASQAGWRGEFVVVSREQAPKHLQLPGNFAQHGEMSSRRIREELGFADPVPLDEAIRRTITWERANPPAKVDPAQFDYAAEDQAFSPSLN